MFLIETWEAPHLQTSKANIGVWKFGPVHRRSVQPSEAIMLLLHFGEWRRSLGIDTQLMTESTLNYFGGFFKLVPKIWI